MSAGGAIHSTSPGVESVVAASPDEVDIAVGMGRSEGGNIRVDVTAGTGAVTRDRESAREIHEKIVLLIG